MLEERLRIPLATPSSAFANGRTPRVALIGLLLPFGLVAGCGSGDSEPNAPTATPGGLDDASAEVVAKVVASEAVVRELGSPLGRMAIDVRNLQFPGRNSLPHMAASVEMRDLVDEPEVTHAHEELGVVNLDWHVEHDAHAIDPAKDRVWQPLFESLAWFERVKFKVVSGKYLDDDHYSAQVGFDAAGRTSDGRQRALHGDLSTVWVAERDGEGNRTGWLAESFLLDHLTAVDGQRQLFAESLDEIVSAEEAKRLRRSLHEEMVVQFFRMGGVRLPKDEYQGSFMPDALGQHPGLAVADVDGDGHEDLYVMVRWGRNMLLRNRGDGTFYEDAARFGLDLPGVSTSAIFADFDNDGDPDLFLGRSLDRSQFFRNEDGRFVDRSSQVDVPLPAFVSSVSAADFDGDGLLDVYFATYGQMGREVRDSKMARRFFTVEQVAELEKRTRDSIRVSLYRAASGVPNLLLRNAGEGRFERAAADESLDHWWNTFQSVWADYDGDGDPDLYLSNDYAPDTLYRNDGGGQFVDVTEAVGGEAMLGFGMGVTVGDYDNDGRQDFYLSNMFSKAGRRITAQVPGIDPRLVRLAQGNVLMRNTGSKLEQVSGNEPGSIPVAKAGWAWGGQFLDIDNDTFLDLYVPSGNYTAPKEIATDVDL